MQDLYHEYKAITYPRGRSRVASNHQHHHTKSNQVQVRFNSYSSLPQDFHNSFDSFTKDAKTRNHYSMLTAYNTSMSSDAGLMLTDNYSSSSSLASAKTYYKTAKIHRVPKFRNHSLIYEPKTPKIKCPVVVPPTPPPRLKKSGPSSSSTNSSSSSSQSSNTSTNVASTNAKQVRLDTSLILQGTLPGTPQPSKISTSRSDSHDRRKSTTSSMISSWVGDFKHQVKDLYNSSPIKKSRRSSSIYSGSSRTGSDVESTTAHQQLSASFCAPKDNFSRGLLKILIDPTTASSSGIRVTVQEITGLANEGCDQCMIKVSIIQARRTEHSSLVSTGSYTIEQYLASKKTEWLPLKQEKRRGHSGLTTSQPINQTWLLPCPSESQLHNNSLSVRLYFAVYFSNSQLPTTRSSRINIGGTSFGIRKLTKELQPKAGWYSILEPESAITKHLRASKIESCSIINSPKLPQPAKPKRVHPIQSFQTTSNIPDLKIPKLKAKKSSRLSIGNISLSSRSSLHSEAVPYQTIPSNKTVTLRRSWCGFGMKICEKSLTVTNVFGPAVCSGVQIGHKVMKLHIGENEQPIVSPDEILSFIRTTVQEYLTVELVGVDTSFGSLQREKRRKSGNGINLAKMATLNIREGQNKSPSRRFSLKFNQATNNIQGQPSIPESPNFIGVDDLISTIEGNQIGLVGIDSQLTFAENIKHTKILSKKRKFIYSNSLQVSSITFPAGQAVGDGGQCWVILLSDMLLITKYNEASDRHVVVENPLKLRYINSVENDRDCDRKFMIVYQKNDRLYLFETETLQQCEMWKKLIRKYHLGEEDELPNKQQIHKRTASDNTQIEDDMCSGVYMGPSSSTTTTTTTTSSSTILNDTFSSTTNSSNEQHNSTPHNQNPQKSRSVSTATGMMASKASSKVKSMKEWGRRKSANFPALANNASGVGRDCSPGGGKRNHSLATTTTITDPLLLTKATDPTSLPGSYSHGSTTQNLSSEHEQFTSSHHHHHHHADASAEIQDASISNKHNKLATISSLSSISVSSNNSAVPPPTTNMNHRSTHPSSGAGSSVAASAPCSLTSMVTLENILQNVKYNGMFMEFLKKEFSDENLEFWNQVEKTKQIKDSKVVAERVNFIWNHYLAAGSEREVNLDDCTRKTVQEKMRTSNQLDIEILTSAQEKIFHLMDRDSFRRFTESDEYRRNFKR